MITGPRYIDTSQTVVSTFTVVRATALGPFPATPRWRCAMWHFDSGGYVIGGSLCSYSPGLLLTQLGRLMSQVLDPTLYRSPADAVAPPERLAYVAAFDPSGQVNDGLAVIDCVPSSPDYGKVSRLERTAYHGVRCRRFRLEHLLQRPVPSGPRHQQRHSAGAPLPDRAGNRWSRIYVLDTAPGPPDPPRGACQAEELAREHQATHTTRPLQGYSCLPWAVPTATTVPAGSRCSTMSTFDVVGAWGLEPRGACFGYDAWWHLNHDTVITSEWATPSCSRMAWTPKTCSAAELVIT